MQEEEKKETVSEVLLDGLAMAFESRAVPPTLLFLAAGMMAGFDSWKIAAICTLALFAHVNGIARRRLEQLSFIAVVCAAVAWLNLLPSRETLVDAKAQLIALLH